MLHSRVRIPKLASPAVYGLRNNVRVFDFNVAAIAAYERIGFVREGTCREAVRVGQEVWDVVIMSLLRRGWPASWISSASRRNVLEIAGAVRAFLEIPLLRFPKICRRSDFWLCQCDQSENVQDIVIEVGNWIL